MKFVLLIFGAYLTGSIPFGVLVGRACGVDIRRYGSGNIGFSNVLRVLGIGPAAVVLIADAMKGFAPVFIGGRLLTSWGVAEVELWLLMVALAAILGHSFSVFLRFSGGRAVTTTAGVLIALCWPAAAIGFAIWLVLVALTHYISVGSMVAAASVPVYMSVSEQRWEWVVFWSLIAGLVILRHLPNIKRLLKGTEVKIGQRVDI